MNTLCKKITFFHWGEQLIMIKKTELLHHRVFFAEGRSYKVKCEIQSDCTVTGTFNGLAAEREAKYPTIHAISVPVPPHCVLRRCSTTLSSLFIHRDSIAPLCELINSLYVGFKQPGKRGARETAQPELFSLSLCKWNLWFTFQHWIEWADIVFYE